MLFRDKTNNDGKQTGSLYEGADNNGRHSVVVSLLRLTGTGLKGSRTDLTDTESSRKSSKTCTKSRTYSTKRKGLKQHCRK